VVFGTRWVMSYLAGPLTRDHIRSLMSKARKALTAAAVGPAKRKQKSSPDMPALPPAIEQFFVPAVAENVTYYPRLAGTADIVFSNSRYRVEEERAVVYTVEMEEGPVDVDWDNAETLGLTLDELADSGEPGSAYAEIPSSATDVKRYVQWERDFKRWIRQNETINLYRSKRFRLTSEPTETEGDFRARLQNVAKEQRDQAIAKLRKRYASKTTTLENRLLRAQQAIAREKQQSTKKNLDTAVSIATAILGAVLGRKRVSTTSAGRVGTAIKTAGGARKEAADVARAKQTAQKVQADLKALNKQLQHEIDELDTAFDAQAEKLDEIVVRAKTTDIHIPLLGLTWMPYAADSKGRMRPAWN